ncbi:MFS transporter [Clostridium sp.]|uniref:MFS transporter n=1 Tax=Clostridium sp. TaxID=1506 RepID=UPI002FC94425
MKNDKKLLLVMFLLGIFIGALDSGIVSPARTVMANSLSISASDSIWIITIYTLAYAVSMPLAGKLSDRYGKKKLFTFSIIIFGIGSLLCGLSNYYGGFSFLLISRVIQALGGGGIIPIATAFVAESFPPEKRGAALGLVGGIYGIANVLGPTAGSFLLDIAGTSNWGILFLINVPICIMVVIASFRIKDESEKKPSTKMDITGSFVVTALILCLMYALTNLKFHDFANSIKATNVYPYLIAFLILLPIFLFVEKRAEDPVINLKYFTSREIALTLAIGFMTGAGMMGIIFIPQFGENVLKIKTGSGGYLVTLMAVFAGFCAPFGGKLIDKFSAKFILVLGFSCMFIGTLVMATLAISYPSIYTLGLGLAFIGFGMGFTMGTPLNYLIQANVSEDETATAQATLSLIRSIGVAISPNLLINFITNAAKNLQGDLMAVMPKISMGTGAPTSAFSGDSISPEALASLQSADVTTVVDVLKDFASTMLDKVAPMIKQALTGKLPPGVSPDATIAAMKTDYLTQMEGSRALIESTFQNTLNSGFSKLFIGAAVIAFIGLVLSIMLKSKTKSVKIDPNLNS